MIKFLLNASITLGIFLAFGISVSAQDTGTVAEPTGIGPYRSNSPMDSLKTKRRNIVQERMTKIGKIRDEAKSRIQEQKDIFKQKLSAIRDEKKRALVERIDERISVLDKNYTERLIVSVEKLQTVLNKISEKANTAKSSSVETVSVESAIANAQSAIDAAKISLLEQQSKSYQIEISPNPDSVLRSTVGSVVSRFRTDIKALHKKIVDAKQAVRNAEKEMVKLRIMEDK